MDTTNPYPFIRSVLLATMKKAVIVSIIMIIFIVSSNGYAKPSDMFVNYLTDIIWTDCQGKDIEINQPIITFTATNQTLSLMKWPYGKEDLRQVIKLLSEQPYRTYAGQCDGVYSMVSDTGWEGCGILTSENHKLNINFDTYYWDGVKVDVPKEEFKTTYGSNSPIIETNGEKSPVTTGANSPINQQENAIWVQLFLPKVTILGMIIGAIITALVEHIITRWRNKTKKSMKKA